MITEYLSRLTLRRILPKMTNISRSFTYKMAAIINRHRYGTKLRHCHAMYNWTHVVTCDLQPLHSARIAYSAAAAIVYRPLQQITQIYSTYWKSSAIRRNS